MEKKELNKVLKEIIVEKSKNNIHQGIFSDLYLLEANAVGQIGEIFIKKLLNLLNVKVDTGIETTIHDEYDVLLKDGTKIEVKTARLGVNKTYQFNGINPRYNYDYIILLGISEKEAHYLIIKGKVKYNHPTQKYSLKVNDEEKNLVAMNPKNDANYKLTLKQEELLDIESLPKEIKKIF